MQPRELVIQGLTSFTERVTLDFTDVSLFSLVGPTGAGKSSVVDAITLALYGRIPRLKQNEIAPAISTTANECTVGLTFTVRGKPYRAVRTLRRTRTGASTLEAALDHLDDNGNVITTLAGTADDVTVEVERLIGLNFPEFTRSVVLPQGDFARVLRATPKERQDLLSRLLGVGIYDRVKTRAGAHARAAHERAEQTATQIAQLGSTTTTDIGELDRQIAALDELVDRLAQDAKQLEQIRDDYRDASDHAKAARDVVNRVQAIGDPPPAVREHHDATEQADAAVIKAAQANDAIATQLEKAMQDTPSADVLEALAEAIRLHQLTEAREVAVLDARAALEQLGTQKAALSDSLQAAQAAVATAQGSQQAAHREHAAVQAADGLAVGDDCPVCTTTLTAQAPGLNPPADAATTLSAIAEELQTATQQLGGLQAQQQRLQRDIQQATTTLAAAEQARTDHAAALVGQPALDDAIARRDAARQAGSQLTALRDEAKAAADDLRRATQARDALLQKGRGFAEMLDGLRLSVADLDPPKLAGEVAADWVALHDWAKAHTAQAVKTADAADKAVDQITQRGSTLGAQMKQACTDAGVPVAGTNARDSAVDFRAGRVAERARVVQVTEMVDRMRLDEKDAREQELIGSELARLLRTDQFQRWLLDEATRALVSGASVRLSQLSSGRYELGMDEKGGVHVRDLANAGATRNVRTLSGGETFLASLALALSLAEQIAMSATGPVALESLFIDEGFGALDPETLDIAAGAIEQLGAGDRTVGVITHVAELAERLPTRFVVQRTSGGSRVERVDI